MSTNITHSDPLLLWQHDESLRRAAELIELSAGRIRAVSFDFFDTLVWRMVGKPTDVFCEVGHRLIQSNLLRPPISAADYEILRRHAEIKTRGIQYTRDPLVEDISIRDIYTQLKPVIADPAAALPIEHDVERDLCILNPLMAGFAQYLKQKGLKLLIVSDIYFSADQLRIILRANRFDPEIFELVLTSCDAGLCKGTGNLFKLALKTLELKPDQLLHVGDNFHPDVIGARRVGVRGCQYLQASPRILTILDRERFLLGGQTPVFSANSLRLLAARLAPGDTDEGFFGQMGALLMGPVLTRFASWACDQFVASGVRKVGALMREGELFGKVLQNDADARGLDLEITPLYVNRRATDLAAIGRLTAENLIEWLDARQTLPIRTILEHFSLGEDIVKRVPFALDAKANTREEILKLAKFLFTPDISRRIEAKSAEERQKVIDYLRPWLEGGERFGVCDIGYSASAQTQLKHIFDLEGKSTHIVGCYLVSYERAAERVLDGVDIRHYLGAYGFPHFYYLAFLRSPAFMEQSLVATAGTTLGYERLPDGRVKPVLAPMPFDAVMVRRQKSFKEGVLNFQRLWLWTANLRPDLMDGSTDFSRRVLADVDCGIKPILGRATAFPTISEVTHFGSLALDDCYFADAYKPLCGEKDRETLRKHSYTYLYNQRGVHWPHGVFHMENRHAASEFFTCGKAMMLCQTNGDNDCSSPILTVIIRAGKNLAQLRDCLVGVKASTHRDLACEILILVPKENESVLALAREFASRTACIRILEQAPRQNCIQQLNVAADGAVAPLLLFLDDGVLLPGGWDEPLLNAIAAPDVGMVFVPGRNPAGLSGQTLANPNSATRCFLTRRSAVIEALGFKEELTPGGAVLNLAFDLRELQWQVIPGAGLFTEIKPSGDSPALSAADKKSLANRCQDPTRFFASLFSNNTAAGLQSSKAIVTDWIGSFLDHGSLSHVNRELTAALQSSPGIRLQRVSNGVPASPCWEKLAREISADASPDAAVTVRHAWPPDWSRPQKGKLAVIQPWEFGALPEQWVKNAANVDEFWVPSEYVRRVYVESGMPADKVVVVPNGVNPEKFHPQAAPMKLATQKKFKFLFVGGTIFRKGPDLLLKAYLENFTASDDVCLVIKDFGGKTVYAGQTFESQIRAAQSQPDAPEILYLNGELPPDSLPGLYTACDCLVLPYRGEGFGLPALEGMACGLPVIVTAGGATDDFVRDDFAWRIPSERRIFGREVSGLKLAGAGWLLEPDVVALGRFLRGAFTNPAEARRRGQLAARHAREFCSWKKSAARVAQLVLGLASKAEGCAPERGLQPASANQAAKSALSKIPPVSRVKITLPPCALVGHVAEAHELIRQKKFRIAWEAVLAAIARRPFHPEACLLLAEIANIAGDGQTARLCAEHARRIAPGWKPAKKFLNQRLKGGARPGWLKLPDEIGNPKSEIRNRLSICLIVKNEEKFLGQCLESVRDLASQIVVMDTGSTDRTVEIAKEHGAEVYSFVWCDDFSAARNAALEHATGDWVLMLDADEELSAAGCEKLKQALNAAAVMAWRLPIVNAGREAEGCSYVPRLFRNVPGLFYVGRVHEQVFSSIEVRRAEWGLENRLGDVTLIHYGYTAEMTRDRNKIERNLRLLERAVEELPDEPHLLMNLGLELARSGRETEALARYQKAFNSLSAKPAAEIVPELRETLLTQLCTRLMAVKRFDEVVCVLTSPLAGMNGGLTASLHFSLGLAHLELKQFREAADQMRQCLAKRSHQELAPINQEINTAAPCHCLALCLAKSGDAAAAETAFEDGLKETGHGDALRLDYAEFLAEQNRPVDALGRLNEVVAKNALHLDAWQLGGRIALSRPEFLEFARDWTHEAMQHVAKDALIIAQRAEALMLSEDTAAALELWRQVWDQSHQPVALAALILCETVESSETHALPEGQGEAVASRAFIAWYQKLISVKANQTILCLNGQTDKLLRALPGAAKILEAAMAEARTAVPAAV